MAFTRLPKHSLSKKEQAVSGVASRASVRDRLDEFQDVYGSRAASAAFRQQLGSDFSRSGQFQPPIQAKPSFRGLSHELAPIQAKLTVGPANDIYEQEADRIAAQVVQRIHAPVSNSSAQGESVQRKEEEDELQLKPIAPIQRKDMSAGGEVSTDLESEINRARGGGQALAPEMRLKMGEAMGADFSGVRVHTDGRADVLNRAVGARAFTTGQDLFFKRGEYQPGSRGGQELIAHELTHVLHQNVEVKIKAKNGEVGGLDPSISTRESQGKEEKAYPRIIPEEYHSCTPPVNPKPTIQRTPEEARKKLSSSTITDVDAPNTFIKAICLSAYTGGGYKIINSVLRDGLETGDAKEWKERGLERGAGALTNSALYAVLEGSVGDRAETRYITTYRGEYRQGLEWEQMKSSRTYNLSGLTSTSKDKAVAFNVISDTPGYIDDEQERKKTRIGGIYMITTPTGLDISSNKYQEALTKKSSVHTINLMPNEREVLLAHGDRYEVAKVKYVRGISNKGYYSIELDYIESASNSSALRGAADILARVQQISKAESSGYFHDNEAATKIAEASHYVSIDLSQLDDLTKYFSELE